MKGVVKSLLSALIVLAALYGMAIILKGRLYEMVFDRGLIPHIILIISSFGIGLLLKQLASSWRSASKQQKVSTFLDKNTTTIHRFVRSGQSSKSTADREKKLFSSLPEGRDRDQVVGLLRDCREGTRSSAVQRWEMALDLEHQAVEESFRVPQVLAWTVPMLGFLGTVWGIASSLSSFTGVLGDVDNIAQIKEGLGTVTAGLSIAFDTTLLGLFFAIVITGLATYVQRRETTLLNGLERIALDLLKTLSESDVLDPRETEDARTALTSAAGQLQQAFTNFEERIGKLQELIEKQSSDLSGERKGLLDAVESFGRSSNDLSRIAEILQAPREYRFVEQTGDPGKD